MRKSKDRLIALAALWGASGCTEGNSQLGGHAGDAGTSSASGGETAEGGSATGGRSNAMGGNGGRAASGGARAEGGNASGGRLLADGGAAGAATGGAAGAAMGGEAGGGTCVVPPASTLCGHDDDCSAGEYCADACAPSECRCLDDALVCNADCRNACATSVACESETAAFAEQLTGEHCTVMVRYNPDQFALTGYTVNCGPVATVSEQDALNRLLPMSSINWSGATSIGDVERTGVYAFTTLYSGKTYRGFISASTGRLLTITEVDADGAGSFREVPTTVWRDPAELGTYCEAYKSSNWFAQIPVGDGLAPAFLADAKLRATAVFEVLRAKFGHVGRAAIVKVGSGSRSEELMFVSAP